jgi:hypothetical protein
MQLSGASGGLFKARYSWQPEISVSKSAAYQAVTVTITMQRDVDWTKEVFMIQPLFASEDNPNIATMGIVYAPTDAAIVTAWMKDPLGSPGYTWKPSCALYKLKPGLRAYSWYGQYNGTWASSTTNNVDIEIPEPMAATPGSLVLINSLHGIIYPCISWNNAHLGAVGYRRLNDSTMRIRLLSNYGNDQIKYSFTAIY